MSFYNFFKNVKRCLWEIRKYRKVLLCFFLMVILVTAVGAIVHNYMSLQSSVGVSG